MGCTVLVSACLCGVCCRYDAHSNASAALLNLSKYLSLDLKPVCPEVDGGLSIPRDPCERRADKIVSVHGTDCTAQFYRGAQIALKRAQDHDVSFCVLKSKSPSCGVYSCYDGSFSRKLVSRPGLTAEVLQDAGYLCIDEQDLKWMCRVFEETQGDLSSLEQTAAYQVADKGAHATKALRICVAAVL